MADILEEIVAYKKQEVEQFKKELSQVFLESRVEILKKAYVVSMSKALNQSDTGIIAEFKRKSPSKRWIKEEGQADVIPASYAHNGASAVSILTDEKYFGGSMNFIKMARSTVDIPILRKDFIIDEYQLFQARRMGADAVLLIAADLSVDEVKSLTYTAHQLDLEILLEMHSIEELDYAELDVDMLGINNRNLGTFYTDVQNSFKLAERLPKDKVRVSESGISNPETIRQLRKAGFQGFLMGEHFMKAANPGLALKEFIEELK